MNLSARTATILSLAGVLIAGAAATAVNAGVLSGPKPTALAEASDTTSVSSIDTTSLNPSDPVAVYRIGDAGSVTLRTVNGGIEVLGISTSVGWTTGPVVSQSAQSVQVELLSPAQGVRFQATLVGGIVTTSVESIPGTAALSGVDINGPEATSAAQTATANTTVDSPTMTGDGGEDADTDDEQDDSYESKDRADKDHAESHDDHRDDDHRDDDHGYEDGDD